MKLHLPSPLRTALLACLALATPCTATLAAATLAVGTVAFSSAYAADIYYNGGIISSWTDGTLMGDTAFHNGDNLIFEGGSANATLGADITAGSLDIHSGAILTLNGAGHTLAADYITLNGLLRLKSQALSTSSPITSTGSGVVEVAWGNTAGSLSSQLGSSFRGALRVNASTYALAASELQNASQTLEILSGSTIQAAAGTYVASIVSEGQNTLQASSGATTFSGELSGNGTLTKTGAGILSLTTDMYHTDDLVINQGTVQWGNAAQGAFNTMLFSSIQVNNGGTFEDSHLGTAMQHRTDVYLNGGTMSAADMQRPTPGMAGLTENYYKSLHVSGTSALNYTWKGIRHFGLLTSEGTEAVTLNISNSHEDTQTVFDRIVNFHGSIGGTAKDDQNRIYIGKVSQAEGYAMTINHNTHSQNLDKSGAGSLTITGTLSVEGTLTLQEGSLTIQQATTATGARLSGGSLTAAALTAGTYVISGTANATHSGNVTVAGALDIQTEGAVSMTNARSDGSVRIAGGTVTLSGSLSGHDSMMIAGGTITAANASGGRFLMSGGSLSLSGNMEVDSFRLADGNLSLTGQSSSLSIHKELNMNYNGSLSHSSLSLDNGIVLSYSPGASQTIKIPTGSSAYAGLEYLSINLLGLTPEQLYQGIDLGIASSVDKSAINISTLSEGSYTLTRNDGYWFLKTNSPTVGAHTMWDRNWGDAIAASGPAGIRERQWTIDGVDPGLYNDPYYSSQYNTAAILTGSSNDRATVYGGAYGTAHIDGSGGTVDRNVWLYARGGSFALMAGGSYNATCNWNLGSANKEVDTHLIISSGATSIGSVVAGNMRASGQTSWSGDGYISVDSGNVSGSVVGGSIHSSQDTVGATHNHMGNSTILIYAPLGTNARTVVIDTTRTDTESGLRDYMYGGVICGGSLNYHSNQTSTQTGDNFITVDFAGAAGRSSDMAKSIAGGHFGSGVQQQTGDTTVRIRNTRGSDFTGKAIAAGHLSYQVDPDKDNRNQSTASEQSQTGNGALLLSDTGISEFKHLIGGHGSIGNNIAPTQSRTGNTTVSLNQVHGEVSSITGGHYSTAQNANQSQTGDINIKINSSRATVTGFLTGGHYSSTNTNSSTQNLTGSTSISIDGGTYEDRVVAGHVMDDPDKDTVGTRGTYTGSITEGTNLVITGGAFGTVQGGSYIHNHTNITSSIGDVTMDLKGGTYSCIIGGYDIDTSTTDGTSASIGDINISLSNVRVTGDIYGGSVLTNNAPALLQRNITLDFVSGSFLGDIYAAGCDIGDRNRNGTGPITESTTVNIHRNASFAYGITISGGYKDGTTGSGGATGSIVTNKTLAFVDGGTYNQNSIGCTYTYFDTVDVTKGATVSLTQSLQAMAQSVTKMGEGTLKLGSRNRVDNVQVTAGTLALQGGSSSLTAIELLQVDRDATLDISAGNCGINGKLVMAGGSTLAVNAAQAASSLQELQWSTDGLVNISIADAPTEGTYTIELFTDRTKTQGKGLAMEAISGIEFDEVEGKYVATASDYLQCTDLSLANAYLVLREDGTLVLTNSALRSLHWSGDDGDVWNIRQDVEWAPHDDEAPSTDFLNGSNVYFTKDGTAANPMTVAVAEDVSPADMTFSQGFYEFTTDTDGSIATNRKITLTEATVDMGALLDTSEKTPSLALVDDDSRFNADNDIHLKSLNSNGTVTIGGNLTLDRGTDNGGTLIVNKDLKLGGSSAFDKLTAQNVTGNKGHTLTTGTSASDYSSIASIDGGRIVVNNGKLDITTQQKTSLTSIGGAGNLETKGNLALAQASRIGGLTAPSLTLSNRLDVDKTLTASSIALNDLQLDTRQAMVTAKTIDAASDAPVAVTVADSIVSRQALVDGKKYYLVQGQGVTAGTSFTINGQESQIISSHRYDYHLQAEEKGVSIIGIVTNYHFYEDSALTENGKAGAKMLDALYRDGSGIANDPNGDIRKVLDAMDHLLVRTHQPEAADTLAAAVAGSTLPTMAMAFSGDMERQLKSIRNRTTTMGLGSECLAYENLPYFNAWVNAEGNHQELSSDTTYTGYKLDSWGGTVGFDVDMSNSFTWGFAITALMGDFSASGADSLDGNLDTQYMTLFARYYKRAWVHTFVASLGRVDVSYDRTVAIPGYGGYTTTGDTDGMGYGLMYEVGYVMAMNEAATVCLQPVANITLAHASISGYAESGGNASLLVDDMDMTTLSFGAGARVQAAFGENIYNRTSLFEARALVKFMAGDRRGQADNAFAAAEQIKGTVKSAELGSVGIELGAGITVPVGAEAGAIFADMSVDAQSGYTAVNGTIGYRVNF